MKMSERPPGWPAAHVRWSLIAVLLLALTIPVGAAELKTLRGHVADADDHPIANARVILVEERGEDRETAVATTASAADGTFSFAIQRRPDASYWTLVDAPGWAYTGASLDPSSEAQIVVHPPTEVE